MLQACSLAAGSDHVPDNVLREATPFPVWRPLERFCPHKPQRLVSIDRERLSPSSEWAPCECGHLCQSDQQRPSPWRIWMSSNSKPTSSDLRKPQPNIMANIAYSRLARIVS